MNTRFVISLLVAGSLAFACGPRSRSEASSSLPTHPKKLPAGTVSSNFGVDVGEHGVKFVFSITNTSKKLVELNFPNGQSYDFVVLDSIGREVWRWGDGRMFTQSLQNKMLSSGESMRMAEQWKGIARSGTYTAVATLRSSNYPVEQRKAFVVD